MLVLRAENCKHSTNRAVKPKCQQYIAHCYIWCGLRSRRRVTAEWIDLVKGMLELEFCCSL